MKINAIKCGQCDDTVFSRARHDMRSCSCGHCSIDGGFDYTKVNGLFFTFVEVDLPVTRDQLYQDWNCSKNIYGVIKNEEVSKPKAIRNSNTKTGKLPLAKS